VPRSKARSGTWRLNTRGRGSARFSPSADTPWAPLATVSHHRKRSPCPVSDPSSLFPPVPTAVPISPLPRAPGWAAACLPSLRPAWGPPAPGEPGPVVRHRSGARPHLQALPSPATASEPSPFPGDAAHARGLAGDGDGDSAELSQCQGGPGVGDVVARQKAPLLRSGLVPEWQQLPAGARAFAAGA